MDQLNDFKINDTKITESFTNFIGTIGEETAIYMLPKPSINLKELNTDSLNNNSIIIPVTVTPRLIFPASENHVKKLFKKHGYFVETFEEYLKNDEYCKTSWIDNIILKKVDDGKIFYENEDFLIISDYKWNLKSMDQMYLLAIFTNDKLRSIRNLTGDHLDLLKSVRSTIYEICEQLGVEKKHIVTYFHYRPTYFRLHIHIVNIKKSVNVVGSFSRLVFLDDVISNLELDSNYYEKDCYFISQVD